MSLNITFLAALLVLFTEGFKGITVCISNFTCISLSFLSLLQKHCDRQKANLRIRFKPSLFQHVGTHSSLAGKIQKLKVKNECVCVFVCEQLC